MSQIILTKSFQKQIAKFRAVSKKQVITEIKKYISGLDIFVDIYSPAPNLKVLKGYLVGKKIRIAILFIVRQEQYIPFFLAKKESRQGWNVSKQSEVFLENFIIKSTRDIENGNFEVIKVINSSR